MSRVFVFAVAGLLAWGGWAAMDQHDHGVELGTVRFPVSCTADAQKTFERGVALLHSFWYEEAERTFADTTRTDPGCAMAYWGIAMTHYHPVWEPPGAADLAKGSAAVAAAKSAGPKTQRERDYIAAIEAFYQDWDRVPHGTRALAWRNAMERLAASYPEDREAAIFYALSLIGTAPATDKTYASQKQAAAILNRILPEQPNHPGIAHYMIHSYDSPQLASLALPAARSYARIASGAPHALHMPSHIFVRLGLWQDSIASNIASARAAKEHIERTSPGTAAQDQLHAMDYLAYAYLQTCRDDEAQRVVDEAAAVSKVDQQVFQTAYALAAIPARYTLERRRWEEAAALTVRPTTFPWGQFRYAEAITHFARALGAARTGNPAAARREVEILAAIQKSLAGRQGYDWATQVEVQRQGALAWAVRAEGDGEGALRWMRSAADLEDRSEKHPVTPGAVLPARELLGDLLLEMKRPAEAKLEFEAVLQGAPKRFNATYGAARAAELSGDVKRAGERYTELLELGGPDAHRPEVQAARTFLQRR
jgi:tetratricopeptide (TPR) repeat protein